MRTAKEIGIEVGLSERRIQELAKDGRIPSIGVGPRRFDLGAVRVALAARTPSRANALGPLLCSICKRELPQSAFILVTRRDKRCQPGHSWTGPSSDCRECRNARKRKDRHRKAEAAGREFISGADRMVLSQERQSARRARYELQLLERRQAAESKAKYLAESEELHCAICKRTLHRSSFVPSRIRGGVCICTECNSERDRGRFQRNKDALSDAYVKRQLTKHSSLAAGQIPQSMIDAKRVQLLLERALPTEVERYRVWLAHALQHGPVDAEHLNRAAASAGFNFWHTKNFRIVRRNFATYDESTNMWRIK